MLAYYLNLALRSFRRNKALTVLMVLTIGFGVAASMTSWAVFRAVSGDPMPSKSAHLFVPQIDNWGPGDSGPDDEPPTAFTYTDAIALMRDHRARRQSAMYQIGPSIVPAEAGQYPINGLGHAVFSEFFPMLETPFLYGAGWSAADDEHRAQVAVISRKLNRQLFAEANSVGRSVNIDGRDYRVVGVLDDWNPQPRFFDVVNSGGFEQREEDVFLPFNTAIDAEINNSGNLNCNATPEESGFTGIQRSECIWISYMVELQDAAEVTAFRAYLDGYAQAQQDAGRFDWPPNNRLRDLRAWLDARQVVPDDTRVSLVVAFGLLLVCMVNTVGLLLAKFLRRSGEIGVRRALGAPRRAIYLQFLVEAGTIGLAGGVLGLLLTGLGVASVAWVLPPEIANLARIDVSLLLASLALAVLATLLAGLYPVWCAARVQPAWQLKSN